MSNLFPAIFRIPWLQSLRQLLPVKSLGGVGMQKLVSALMSVCITILLARLLGPQGFGEYSYVLALVSLATLPLLQGLPVLVLRESVHYLQSSAGLEIRDIIQFANRIIISLCSVLLLMYAVFRALYAGRGELEHLYSLIPLTMGIPFFIALTSVRSAITRAAGMPVRGHLPELIVRPSLFLVLMLVYYAAEAHTTRGIIILHLVAAATAFVISVWLMQHATGPANREQGTKINYTVLLRSLIPLSLISGMQVINSQIDLVMLGMLAGAEDTGVYKVAAMLALQVSFVMMIVNPVLAPKFVELHNSGNPVLLKAVNKQGALVSLGGGLLVCLLYLVAGEWLITHLLGESYLGALVPLAILSATHLVTLGFGSSNIILSMTGHEKDVLVAVVSSSILNLILNIFLIPKYGMIGAAISTAMALLCWRLVLYKFLSQRLG